SEHGFTIAPSSYYAARSRPPCARQVRDEVVLTAIVALHADPARGRGLYEVRKVWHQLRREGGVDGAPVARCTVERLMRNAGLRGGAASSAPPAPTRRLPDLLTWSNESSGPTRRGGGHPNPGRARAPGVHHD